MCACFVCLPHKERMEGLEGGGGGCIWCVLCLCDNDRDVKQTGRSKNDGRGGSMARCDLYYRRAWCDCTTDWQGVICITDGHGVIVLQTGKV